MLMVWNVPQAQLEWAAENFNQTFTNDSQRNMNYWKLAARQVDRLSRVYIVSAYVICFG